MTSMENFVNELGKEFTNLSSDEIAAAVNSLAALGSIKTADIRTELTRIEQDRIVSRRYGLDEKIREAWFPNIHGRELDEQLEDFFEEYDLV